MARVVVGMSGGVDSSLAAWLLLQQGHEVIGLFMRNWNDASVTLEDECPWIEDSKDAMIVAEQLGIPFQVLDLSEVYKKRIVDYMFAEYEKGRTPNPDVLCNREIKFDVFLNAALKLGADYVATGHYVRKGTIQEKGEVEYQLLSGVDENKDQSYFLCQLNQYQLSKALFPIGELKKAEVRNLAEKAGLWTAQKKDSQGLCFIGKVSLPDFLQQQLRTKKGNVIKIDKNHSKIAAKEQIFPTTLSEFQEKTRKYDFEELDGTKVGEHFGAHFYTIGQRKGLNIGGMKEPLFVIETSIETNTVYVGEGAGHPALWNTALAIDKGDLHWIRRVSNNKEEFGVKVRYRQKNKTGKLFDIEGKKFIQFDQPLSAITPGQFVALYLKDELVASAVIA